MNEKGFFTLIGLCFLLVAALLVRGVQESEKNYSNITTDFHTEVDLQNVADSALIEAMNMIKLGKITLKESSKAVANRRINQHEIEKIEIANKLIKDVNVKVFYEYGKIDGSDEGNIYFFKRTHKSKGTYEDTNITDTPKKGVILISVASREIDGNKFYRRAIGYFLTDEDTEEDGKIYFMNSLDKEK